MKMYSHINKSLKHNKLFNISIRNIHYNANKGYYVIELRHYTLTFYINYLY